MAAEEDLGLRRLTKPCAVRAAQIGSDPLQPADPPSSELTRYESALSIDGLVPESALSLRTMQEVATKP